MSKYTLWLVDHASNKSYIVNTFSEFKEAKLGYKEAVSALSYKSNSCIYLAHYDNGNLKIVYKKNLKGKKNGTR